jgi:hypothetical protein
MVSEVDIEAKRQIVRRSEFGTKEYHQAFDELHDLNLKYMGEMFCREWGLPPGSKTPYSIKGDNHVN